MKKLTTPEFIAKALMVHGQRYNYKDAHYINGKIKISIICYIHGLFKQTPSDHLSGKNCSKCAAISRRQQRADSKDAFINKARDIHGFRYDYSAVNYINSGVKVQIICPLHGAFKQAPEKHLAGQQCKFCSNTQRTRNQTQDVQEFIDRAKVIHSNKYNYTHVRYVNARKKVRIICPNHGAFEQPPGSHLSGHGCIECRADKLKQLARLTWVERAAGRLCSLYFIRLTQGAEVLYKVGVTCLTLQARYHDKKSLSGYQYELLALYQSTDAEAVYDWEQAIIETFSHLKYTPKQLLDGHSECFSAADEILAAMPVGTRFYYPDALAA